MPPGLYDGNRRNHFFPKIEANQRGNTSCPVMRLGGGLRAPDLQSKLFKRSEAAATARGLSHDIVALRAQVCDAALQDVSDRHEFIFAHAHTRWSSSCDDVARNHSHVARKIGKYLINGKQHVTRISLLLLVTVEFRPYVKFHWIDAGSEIGADRTIRRTRLCTHKVLLFLRIHLSRAIRDIVEANIAEDVVGSLPHCDVLRFAPDNNGKFGF